MALNFSPAARGLAASLILSLTYTTVVPALAAIDAPGEAGAFEKEDHSAAAIELGSGDLHSAPWNLWQSHVDAAGLDGILDDESGRIPELFKVPAGMRTQVGFWLQVYTRYTSREAILFDEEHPEIVYEVLDFRNLARTARNRAAYEIVSRQVMRERIGAYQRAFLALDSKGSAGRRARASREGVRILEAIRALPHGHRFDELKKNLRVQWGQRDQVMQGLVASAPYRARMDHVFEAMKLPRELTLLSLVESSFNTQAMSHAGAAGVWQFMPDSGAEFMRVHPAAGVDERVSPIKSTAAAARLLLRNYKMLQSWPAAIGAYNHGHGKWRKVPLVHRRNPSRILTQCSRTRGVPAKLGFASRNYYAEFLALLRAERYQERVFGPAPAETGQPVRFVAVEEATRIDLLAQEHSLAPKVLLELNPDLLAAQNVVPGGFLLAVPANEDEFDAVIEATLSRQRRFHTNRSARRSALQAAYSISSVRKRRG